MDFREQRGIILAATTRLIQHGDHWLVPASSGAKNYIVNPAEETCTCDDFGEGYRCKHLIAVEIVAKRELDGSIPPPEVEIGKFPEKPIYRQNWPAYNKAQCEEKDRFQQILHDLCQNHLEPFAARTGPGRRPVPASDAVFAAAFKVHSTMSGRRFSCDMRDAAERGYLKDTIHHNSISRYLDNKDLTSRLHKLITVSSLPLKIIETVFAADATGFSSARFVRWLDEKHNITRTGHDWLKVAVMCGVKTNVITAVNVEHRHAAEAPQFKRLLAETLKNFTIAEVSADKAYSSVENIQAVYEAGGEPYIAFKSNASGMSGGFFEKAFHYYSLNRDEFLKHYHKRSNVESTFSSLKRKYGSFIRSKADTAMVNEVLCKVLCHNISCLIHSQHELGIAPIFWKDESPSGKELINV